MPDPLVTFQYVVGAGLEAALHVEATQGAGVDVTPATGIIVTVDVISETIDSAR